MYVFSFVSWDVFNFFPVKIEGVSSLCECVCVCVHAQKKKNILGTVSVIVHLVVMNEEMPGER